MTRPQTTPASAEATTEASRDTKRDDKRCGPEDFQPKVDLPGKTDSGPEPDVFGKEIPPQD